MSAEKLGQILRILSWTLYMILGHCSICIVSTASQEDSEKEVSSQGGLGRHV